MLPTKEELKFKDCIFDYDTTYKLSIDKMMLELIKNERMKQ